MQCPLCRSSKAKPFASEKSLTYFHCEDCDLRFLDSASHLSHVNEKARYDEHNNDSGDPRYRDFLRPLVQAITARMPEGHGLDFGAGKDSPIPHMLPENFKITPYDPNYFPDKAALARPYDFIAASEVLEHVREPDKEMKLLRSLLKPGGLLAVMTLLYKPETDFLSWFYRRDPTHVVFYSETTVRWLKEHYQFSKLELLSDRLFLLS